MPVLSTCIVQEVTPIPLKDSSSDDDINAPENGDEDNFPAEQQPHIQVEILMDILMDTLQLQQSVDEDEERGSTLSSHQLSSHQLSNRNH